MKKRGRSYWELMGAITTLLLVKQLFYYYSLFSFLMFFPKDIAQIIDQFVLLERETTIANISIRPNQIETLDSLAKTEGAMNYSLAIIDSMDFLFLSFFLLSSLQSTTISGYDRTANHWIDVLDGDPQFDDIISR